jgi:hypothetical protein
MIEEAPIGGRFSKNDQLAATFVTQSGNGSVEVSNGEARGSRLVLDPEKDRKYRISHMTNSIRGILSIVIGLHSPISFQETQAGLVKSGDLFLKYICSCAGTNSTNPGAMATCLKYVREKGLEDLNKRYVIFFFVVFFKLY